MGLPYIADPNGNKINLFKHFFFYGQYDLLGGHSKMTSPGYRGSGYPKLVTKSDILGRRVHANSDITTTKSTYKFLFSACFWSARQHLSFGVDSSGGVV